MTGPSAYSALDRLFHRLAFANIGLQLDLSKREDGKSADAIATLEQGRSVYITAMPRAGTTLLLTLLAAHPDFASHTYRQMPVLFAPLTWQAWSRRFATRAKVRERAHGDGLDVSEDSAEAFEEALWRAFWQAHYGERTIALWRAEENHPEFEAFYRRHRAKLILAHNRASAEGRPAHRYLAKNNANIARLDWLTRHDPEALVIVPLRDPFAHIASLMRQDENFMRRHGDDRFAERYMRDLGHFEFGRLHRLFAFPEAPEWQLFTGRHVDYWARYWRAAHTHLAAHRDPRIRLFDYDAFCNDPGPAIERLARNLGIDAGPILPLLKVVRPNPPAPELDVDFALSAELRDLHVTLAASAI
ncbi:MAG: sulfotransferase [Hyphomicrobiaceae bacterium]|nr:sulfotransferase [Hyphomicrobiaceae bacterium]